MAFTNKFNFVGDLVIPKENAKTAFVVKSTTKSKAESWRLNVGIKTGDHNMAFCELFDFERDEFKFKMNDEEVVVAWDDRLDPDNVAKAPYSRVISINLGEVLDEAGNPIKNEDGEEIGGRKQFLSGVDAIQFFKNNVEYVKNKKFSIGGQVQFQPYKDKIFTKYQINRINVVPDDVKVGLFLDLDLFYSKDSLDTSDWKKEQIYGLDAYVNQYINKDEGNKYIPQRVVFNCSKADMENEKVAKRVEFYKGLIEVSGKKVVHMPWQCKLISGSEEVEVTIDMLTKKQKEAIELGIKTLEDFQKKTFGDRIVEIRLVTPMLELSEFEDGYVELDESIAEFEDLIYIPTVDEKLEDVVNEEKKSTKEDKEETVSDDDLFG